MFARLKNWIDSLIWGDRLQKYGLPGRIVVGVLRNAYAVLRDIVSGQLTLRAMSLVYTTLLSIVPLLALSFSALKSLGVDKDLEARLYGVFEPLGDKGVEITNNVMTLVNNVNVGVLGGIGLAFFIYTAVTMVQKIEEAFNYVWYVIKPRSFATRLVEYTAVLVVGSLAVAIGIRTLAMLAQDNLVVTIQENTVIAPAFTAINTITPYLVIIAIFTFLYKLMPNTNVRLKSALVGGAVGGFLWVTTSTLFAAFVSTSTNRQAIYASFAVAISALLWLYLNWLILLIGSQVAFYFQNPAYLKIGRREPRLSNAMRERIALNVMYLVAKEFRNPVIGVNLDSLSRAMRIPTITLSTITSRLEAADILTTNEHENLLPGREMSRIKLAEILAVVRQEGETGSHRNPRWDAAIDNLAQTIDDAVAGIVEDMSLSDLLDRPAAE